MGFARIKGAPESYVGINVNGGKNPEAPASFTQKGKTGGILAVNGTLYARLNLQDGKWPDVNFALAWSEDSWGNMGTAGFGLNCDFPQKWMSTDGLAMWSIFSVYGDGAKKGIDGHDRFNLGQNCTDAFVQ